VTELLAEAIGFLLELVAPAATEAPAEVPATEAVGSGHPSRDVIARGLTLMFGLAFVALTVAVPVLWATGRADGLTLVGVGVAALIAGRSAYLLARYRRNRVTL
jgi:hypothetical protein